MKGYCLIYARHMKGSETRECVMVAALASANNSDEGWKTARKVASMQFENGSILSPRKLKASNSFLFFVCSDNVGNQHKCMLWVGSLEHTHIVLWTMDSRPAVISNWYLFGRTIVVNCFIRRHRDRMAWGENLSDLMLHRKLYSSCCGGIDSSASNEVKSPHIFSYYVRGNSKLLTHPISLIHTWWAHPNTVSPRSHIRAWRYGHPRSVLPAHARPKAPASQQSYWKPIRK